MACLLLPLAGLYGAINALRRALYALGLLRSIRLPVPVIVVGNLIAGGAGKTPMVMALITMLRRHGFTPGVISRGYGRRSSQLVQIEADTPLADGGDEPVLIHRRTGVPVAVSADRIAAAHALLHRHPEVDLLISDDGLQHHRLQRDAQVIVFDDRGIGNGWLLPAGPLRERPQREVPARSVVVYNAARPSTDWPGHIATRGLGSLKTFAQWRSASPHSSSSQTDGFAVLTGQPIVAAAGVAHPERFFNMLRARGLTLTELPLPDHHGFTELPWPDVPSDIVVTEKDAVKLAGLPMQQARVWVATLDFALGPDFETELLRWLPGAPQRNEHGHTAA